MYIPFDQLSDEARIWVYQASRPFRDTEVQEILRRTCDFLEQWTSHGQPLRGSADILYGQFLTLAVEEKFQGATGCAVDASIQFIRDLEQIFQVDLLSRTHVAFRQNNTNRLVPLGELRERIQQGAVLGDVLTFDNTITKKWELSSKWLVRADTSWLSRYFSSSVM